MKCNSKQKGCFRSGQKRTVLSAAQRGLSKQARCKKEEPHGKTGRGTSHLLPPETPPPPDRMKLSLGPLKVLSPDFTLSHELFLRSLVCLSSKIQSLSPSETRGTILALSSSYELFIFPSEASHCAVFSFLPSKSLSLLKILEPFPAPT